MLNIGPQELLLILLVALLVVGPKRLPELSRTIGRGLREFRKAQDEVSKTIRLGLDDSEPATRKPVGASPTAPTAKDDPSRAPETAPTPSQPSEEDESADIARTLGRGLSEIRRARREIQQTFRVDLTDRPPRSAARPTTRPTAPTSRSLPDEATQPPDRAAGPGEAGKQAPEETPAGPPPEAEPGSAAEPAEPA